VPSGQPHPRHRVGFHDGGRGATSVTCAGYALDGGIRWHPDLNALAGVAILQESQEVFDRGSLHVRGRRAAAPYCIVKPVQYRRQLARGQRMQSAGHPSRLWLAGWSVLDGRIVVVGKQPGQVGQVRRQGPGG
jgi:hypothetical protein